MFVDNNEQEYTLLDPGTHRMKWVESTITENYTWILTFQKGNYKVGAFGKMPRLKSESEGGNKEQWLRVVGPKGGWLVSTVIFFEKIMGKDEVNQVIRKVSKEISAEYPTQDEQFSSWKQVMESSKKLVSALYEAATPYLSNFYFDVDTEATTYIDKEGNEKPKLQVVPPSLDNEYKIPYRISENQTEETPVVSEQTPDPQVTEEVPDWVNERTERKEPADSEW